jgi:hypothetical protein
MHVEIVNESLAVLQNIKEKPRRSILRTDLLKPIKSVT